MQSTQFVNELMSGPQIEVVGVPKDDLSAQRLEFLLGDGFDGARSSHRHKDWSRDLAVGSSDLAPTRLGVGIGGNEVEMQSVSCGFRVQAFRLPLPRETTGA